MDLAAELQHIYDSEINVSISWLWDVGITVRLGDEMNGFLAEETFADTAGIGPWLQHAVAHFYPGSSYAQSLDVRVRAFAAQRLFNPPTIGKHVRCPNCGAPNAALEQFAFICSRCRASVAIDQRKIQ